MLLFDCLRPALDALGLSEDKDAGRFLEALDELTCEAGIAESLVVHHMGHSGERSRGDSRIQDWPDVLWSIVKDAEDEEESSAAPRRYFKAYGRDVDIPEQLLGYESSTRRLSIAGGSRTSRKADEAARAVLESVRSDDGDGLSGRQVEARLKDTGITQRSIRSALRRLVDSGQLERQDSRGRGGGYLYRVTASSAFELRQHGPEKCVSASIEDAQRTQSDDEDQRGSASTHLDTEASPLDGMPEPPAPPLCTRCQHRPALRGGGMCAECADELTRQVRAVS